MWTPIFTFPKVLCGHSSFTSTLSLALHDTPSSCQGRQSPTFRKLCRDSDERRDRKRLFPGHNACRTLLTNFNSFSVYPFGFSVNQNQYIWKLWYFISSDNYMFYFFHCTTSKFYSKNDSLYPCVFSELNECASYVLPLSMMLVDI